MNKNFLLTMFFVLVMVLNVNADEIINDNDSIYSLNVSHYKTIVVDPEAIVQSGYGMQLSLHRKNIFLYLSKDKNQVRFAGQSGPEVNFWSLGIGTQHKLGKHLIISTDVGWYRPKFKEMGERQIYPTSGPFSEGLCRYMNKFLMPDDGYPAWDYYTLNYKGGIGGKLNLDFEYPITEKFSFDMTVGYRFLKVQEHIEGRDFGNDISYWTIRYDRDFSVYMIGATFTYNF